jgi:hypothetical protein
MKELDTIGYPFVEFKAKLKSIDKKEKSLRKVYKKLSKFGSSQNNHFLVYAKFVRMMIQDKDFAEEIIRNVKERH